MEPFWGPQKIHPLLIDHVVEKIFDHADPQDDSFLMQTRLVCHQWNILASKALQNHSTGVISFGKFFHAVPSMEDLFKTVQESAIFPFVNFRLCQDVFQPCHESLVKDFFRKCSPVLSSLIIRLDVESTLQISEGFFSQLNLPRLKTLVYDDRRSVSEAFDKNLLCGLLNASADNLETLSLHKQPEAIFEIEDQYDTFVERVCDIIKGVNLRKLKNLQIDIELCDQLILCLSHFQGIENLSVCLRTSDFKPETLKCLLKCLSGSLKKLKLGGICKKSCFELRFPRLERLESLEIQGWCSSVPEVKLSNFTYHENFPVLKTLLLNTWRDDPCWLQFFNYDDIHEMGHLRKLKLPQELLNPELIHNMQFSFVNLRVLELHYTENSIPVFEKVFQSLGQLEELKICPNFQEYHSVKNIDSLLTGLSGSVCRKMLKGRDFQQPLETLRSKPGLANLENLKVLDMKELLKYQACITDVSGYMGFLKLKNLKRLKISRSQIQYDCLTLLSEKFPLDLKQELEEYDGDTSPEYTYQLPLMSYCNIS